MTARNPVEFTKELPNGKHQRVGNEVEASLTAADIAALAAAIAAAIAIALADAFANAVDEINLVPNALGSDQLLTVTQAAGVVTFASEGVTFHADTTHIHIRSEVAAMRVTWDGIDPTAGTIPPGLGEPLLSNDMGYFKVAAANAARFITNTATTGYVQVSEWMVP